MKGTLEQLVKQRARQACFCPLTDRPEPRDPSVRQKPVRVLGHVNMLAVNNKPNKEKRGNRGVRSSCSDWPVDSSCVPSAVVVLYSRPETATKLCSPNATPTTAATSAFLRAASAVTGFRMNISCSSETSSIQRTDSEASEWKFIPITAVLVNFFYRESSKRKSKRRF